MLSVGKLTGFLKYLPVIVALLVQKLWREKNCQNPFPAILRQKKVPTATKPGGVGVKALVALPLKTDPFFAASLKGWKQLSYGR